MTRQLRITFYLACLTWVAAVHAQGTVSDWIKLDVPYVGTPPVVMNAMLDLAAVGPGDVVYDLGSGDGRIVIAAVKDRGAARGVGIELNPRRIAEAEAKTKAAGVADRVSYVEGDLFKADFSAASVVTMYLWDNVNLRLRPRILNELKPGTRVVSHQFHMFEWKPDAQVLIGEKVPVMLWIVPAKVDGRWTGPAGEAQLTLDLAQMFQVVTGSLGVGDSAGKVRLGRLNGAALSIEAMIGEQSALLIATADGDSLTGTLSLNGATQNVVLRKQ